MSKHAKVTEDHCKKAKLLFNLYPEAIAQLLADWDLEEGKKMADWSADRERAARVREQRLAEAATKVLRLWVQIYRCLPHTFEKVHIEPADWESARMDLQAALATPEDKGREMP